MPCIVSAISWRKEAIRGTGARPGVPGAQVGKPEATGAALFKDGTRTLSW